MLGPVARSRILGTAAALLTLTGASAVLGVGSPQGDRGTSRAASSTVFVGPVAPAPVPQPLVRSDGPLLPYAVTRDIPVLRPMGPQPLARTTQPAAVGPNSPVAHIRALQRRLNARGAQLRVDGAWGPATARAVQLHGR